MPVAAFFGDEVNGIVCLAQQAFGQLETPLDDEFVNGLADAGLDPHLERLDRPESLTAGKGYVFDDLKRRVERGRGKE